MLVNYKKGLVDYKTILCVIKAFNKFLKIQK